jgi:hypothetical protein
MSSDIALIEPYGAWRDNKNDLEFILKSQDIGLNEFRKNCYKRMLSQQLINTPCIKLIFGSTKAYENCIRIDKLDYAVDNVHYGPETHEYCADIIVEQYANIIR